MRLAHRIDVHCNEFLCLPECNTSHYFDLDDVIHALNCGEKVPGGGDGLASSGEPHPYGGD